MVTQGGGAAPLSAAAGERLVRGYWVNAWLSLGLLPLWRRHAVALTELRSGAAAIDAMCGDGAAWGLLAARVGAAGRIVAVDRSRLALRAARSQAGRLGRRGVHIELRRLTLPGPALTDAVPGGADAVMCVFGVKCLTPAAAAALAADCVAALRPGGRCVAAEFAPPAGSWVGALARAYTERLYPLLGAWLGGGAVSDLRLLGALSRDAASWRAFTSSLAAAGCAVRLTSSRFGLCRFVVGQRMPNAPEAPRPSGKVASAEASWIHAAGTTI